ncbi:stabilizer of axonemal microtubules 5-like [Lineus longissimus]|uniref:stabilizer of axonemal microtubules 5-like n=1 Tax=Lineus longissimus TaxID=88925 RepID=UPI002B4DCB7A
MSLAIPRNSVPLERQIQPIKSGTDFLESSTFKMCQDPNVIKPAYLSTFKRDYPPHPFGKKSAAAEPPAPAHVMHGDVRFFNRQFSETVAEFEKQPASGNILKDAHTKLNATNYKMDKDLTKFNSFHTTHSLYFPPHHLKDYSGFKKTVDKPLESFIPQGDKEKAPYPMSDYKDHYQGHDTSKVVVLKAPSMHAGGPPTITGDGRLQQFDTTHNDQFDGKWEPKVATLPAPTGTNIPQGDKEKVGTKLTTQQQSYQANDLSGANSYDKSLVMKKLGFTNFRLDDGHDTWNTYESTHGAAYGPMPANISRSLPAHHRNHSDLPPGDLDARRVMERVSDTTYKFHHGTHPHLPKPVIESGANKRTKSNVWFGEPRLARTFYDTTVGTEFTPADVPYKYDRSSLHAPSSIPLDYYGKELTTPTNKSDFKNPLQGKMIPNHEAVERLRRTNIHPPTGTRIFSTEHLEQFTPKTTALEKYDAGQLQRSSVPLGTMTISKDSKI